MQQASGCHKHAPCNPVCVSGVVEFRYFAKACCSCDTYGRMSSKSFNSCGEGSDDGSDGSDDGSDGKSQNHTVIASKSNALHTNSHCLRFMSLTGKKCVRSTVFSRNESFHLLFHTHIDSHFRERMQFDDENKNEKADARTGLVSAYGNVLQVVAMRTETTIMHGTVAFTKLQQTFRNEGLPNTVSYQLVLPANVFVASMVRV